MTDKMPSLGREMAQQLRAHVAFTEDLCLIPSIYIGELTISSYSICRRI